MSKHSLGRRQLRRLRRLIDHVLDGRDRRAAAADKRRQQRYDRKRAQLEV